MGRIKRKNEPAIQVHQPELVPVSEHWVRSVVQFVFQGENFSDKPSISVVFTDDETIHRINVQYLQHDWPTDVIAFQLDDRDQENWGEMYISHERVRDQAQTYQVSIQNELTRLIVHGTLHLLGFEDKTSAQREMMTQKENRYIRQIHKLEDFVSFGQ